MQNHKRILKIKEENKLKKQNLKKEGAITLVALVVTIIVLIILATVTITIVVGENGLINRAQQSKTLQENAKDKEELDMILLGYNLSNETKKANNQLTQELKDYLLSEGATAVKEKGDNLIVTFKGSQYTVNKTTLASGAYQTEGLNATDEEKVVNALKSETKLLTVNYEPTPTDSTYIVPDKYSGVNTSQDDLTVGQNFTQAGLLGTGDNKLKWYVLSTDDEGVNLVSDVTKASISFKDSPGYDNCLYYLDKVSKEFFSNESQYGVTKDRVHALRLTDIKKAAEQVNAGYKVGERAWNWDSDLIEKATRVSDGVALKNTKTYTDSSYTYYPAIYETDENGVVGCNNMLYDEAVINMPITEDSGISRENTYNPASRLTVTATFFDYLNQRESQMNNLGLFGRSEIGNEIFGLNRKNWLASRCIEARHVNCSFHLRWINSGSLNVGIMCYSGGDSWLQSHPFRVVVSIPASHISVADDGTVSLK